MDNKNRRRELEKRQSELAREYLKYKEDKRPVSLLSEIVTVQNELLALCGVSKERQIS